jgi:hypothetical protein
MEGRSSTISSRTKKRGIPFMNPYYAWLIIFGIFAYFIAVDQSIATYVVLTWKICRLKYERLKWMILNDPRNPIVKFMIERKYSKIAEELEKQLNKDN